MLVAFWRMLVVSLVWNAVLWSTGRRITMEDVRQVFVPGIFFGLNLAVFFAGATHNSVANAALIGSLAPFLIVPAGAWFFKEYIHPRALLFAALAFGGVALVLLSAPPRGDASLEGNVFGVDRDAAAGRVRRLDEALPPGHGRHHLHGDDLPDRDGGRAAAGARPRRRVRAERHRMDLHADPHAHQRGRRPGAGGLRAEDDPDRHDRDRPGGAARARGRVVVPAAGRGGEQPAGGGHRHRHGRVAGFRGACNQRGDAERPRRRRRARSAIC